jgi:hypothetical protein
MILILTQEDDPHADAVIEGLRRRGAEWFRFNPARFPSGAELSFSCTESGNVRSLLRTPDEAVDLEQVGVVWYRRPHSPVPHAEITDPRVRQYVADECQLVSNDVFHALDAAWLPAPPGVIRRAELKAAQLKVAGALGFEVPPTLLTNSPEAFLEFYRLLGGEIVSKLASRSFMTGFGQDLVRYTEVVSRRDVGYARSLRYSPVLFQGYVPKRVELRATVVGQRVFAAEIHSQATNHTKHDWRRYDIQHTGYLPHELPHEVERCCVRLVERLGLRYGAIDLILTPDDRYVFIEINPNGQYLWI